jgi:hypothetical protein
VRNLPDETAADDERVVGEEFDISATERNRTPFLPMGYAGRLSIRYNVPALSAKKSIASVAASSLRSVAPAISMMKAAEPGTGDHGSSRRRLAFHKPSMRCVLIEGIVNPVVVVVV